MTNKISLIKLTNGTDLLSEVVSNTPNFIHIKKPVVIVVIPPKAPNQSAKVGFLPWLEFAKTDEAHIDKSHILCIIDPLDDFVTQYKSATSPIVTPKQGLIIP